MRKWTLLHIIILVLAPTMRAESRLHNLVVKFCNEQTLVFALRDKPVATLHADSLHIQTALFEASYLRDEIGDFYFLQAPKDTTSLPEQTIYITYINDHIVRINGVQKGDNAALYSMDGKLLLTQTINDNECILDLSAYARGLYLIQLIRNLNNTSNKQQIISFKVIR